MRITYLAWNNFRQPPASHYAQLTWTMTHCMYHCVLGFNMVCSVSAHHLLMNMLHALQALDCHQTSLEDAVQTAQLMCTRPHFEGFEMKQVQGKEPEHAEVERIHVGCRPVMIQSLVVVDGFSHQHVLVHKNDSIHLSWCISLVARRLMKCPPRMKADFPCSSMTSACFVGQHLPNWVKRTATD